MSLELTIERANRACDLDAGTRHQVRYLESREACLFKLNKPQKFVSGRKDCTHFDQDQETDLKTVEWGRRWLTRKKEVNSPFISCNVKRSD